MYFVVGKNGSNARQKARTRSGATRKLSNAAVDHFYHNPADDAIFATRVVTAFSGMNHYLTRAVPRGIDKNGSRKMRDLLKATP
jgi:hypothetical protein